MKIEIKVPSMGESISEATIGNFIKADHSSVSADDELVELETDKVNQVLYAPKAGELTWSVSKDEQVKIGQVIGYIDTEKAANAPKEAEKAILKQQQPELEPPPSERAPAPPRATSSESQQGVRVTKEAFAAELSSKAPKAPEEPTQKRKVSEAPPQQQPVEAGKRQESRKKMSKIRKLIATRMVNVLQETAMLTTFNEVDMTKIIALRESYKEPFVKHHKVRLGFMSFFVKAVVAAMKEFPEINAYIDGDDLVYREYYDIGIAVGTDKGLVVPVVRECDKKSFAEIEQAIENYAVKAREGGLSADNLQGGGFTITNGGVYGSLLSTPLINPPQCAILGMHKIMKRAVVVDDQIVIRSMMYLALSYDHRIVDGKEAVSFLVHIKNSLEDPSRLLLGI